MPIVEVDRPDRRPRRAHGKSDPLDAYSAARAALSGAAAVVPKLRNGRVEAIRALRVARSSAVKARSQATNQIKSLIVTGPAQLREQLRHMPTLKMIAACARLRPGHQLGDTEHAIKTALRRSPPTADAPTDTGSTAAVTVPPTMRSTLSFLAASATTHAPAPTPSAEPTKACRSPRSSAA